MKPSSPASVITRVEIRNYRSLRHCSTDLAELTVLTGLNGSGKSNFLDSLFFLSECLTTSFDKAIQSRGGLDSLLFSQKGKPRSKFFSIKIYLNLMHGQSKGVYYLKVGYDKSSRRSVVLHEECKVTSKSQKMIRYLVKSGKLISHNLEKELVTTSNNLALDYASSINGFQWVYSALEAITLCNPEPSKIKTIQKSDYETSIKKDGSNTASVLYRIKELSPNTHSKIFTYLNLINQSVMQAEPIVDSFDNVNISFGQRFEKNKRFGLSDMSDGTLRSLSILTALFQGYSNWHWSDDSSKKEVWTFKNETNILLEEIELNIHPGAVGILLDAVREASFYSQVVISTHSPDFLERINLDSKRELVLAIQSKNGESIISSIDSASREIVQRNLYTLGDLLRMNQIEPESDLPKLKKATL